LPGAPDSGDTADTTIDAGIDAGAATPEVPVETPAASPKTDTEAMPEHGGSFIRQADGSLVRANDEGGAA
jgi:hypothetical protein